MLCWCARDAVASNNDIVLDLVSLRMERIGVFFSLTSGGEREDEVYSCSGQWL